MKNLYSTGVPFPFSCYYACEVEDMDLVERSAKLHDALFAIEKNAMQKESATDLDVESAQLIADQIMAMASMMGLKAEHQYVQGHVDKIKEFVK